MLAQAQQVCGRENVPACVRARVSYEATNIDTVICVYVCICVCTCLCTHVSFCIIYIDIYMHTYIYVFMLTCTSMVKLISVFISKFGYMYITCMFFVFCMVFSCLKLKLWYAGVYACTLLYIFKHVNGFVLVFFVITQLQTVFLCIVCFLYFLF